MIKSVLRESPRHEPQAGAHDEGGGDRERFCELFGRLSLLELDDLLAMTFRILDDDDDDDDGGGNREDPLLLLLLLLLFC